MTFHFLGNTWRGREHLQYASNKEAQKLHSAIVPPTQLLELQESLENNSEIQYKFRLQTIAQRVIVNYLKLPVNSVQCAFTSVFINNMFFLHVLNYKSHSQFILNNPVLLSDIFFSYIILEWSTYISPRNIQALGRRLARKHSISKPCPLRWGYSTFNMLKLVYITINSHLCCNNTSSQFSKAFIWIVDLEMLLNTIIIDKKVILCLGHGHMSQVLMNSIRCLFSDPLWKKQLKIVWPWNFFSH